MAQKKLTKNISIYVCPCLHLSLDRGNTLFLVIQVLHTLSHASSCFTSGTYVKEAWSRSLLELVSKRKGILKSNLGIAPRVSNPEPQKYHSGFGESIILIKVVLNETGCKILIEFKLWRISPVADFVNMLVHNFIYRSLGL